MNHGYDYVVLRTPTGNWHSSGFRPEKVKWATGHWDVDNQTSHGISATGRTKKLWKIIKLGTWNVRGLLNVGKLSIVDKNIQDYNCWELRDPLEGTSLL